MLSRIREFFAEIVEIVHFAYFPGEWGRDFRERLRNGNLTRREAALVRDMQKA